MYVYILPIKIYYILYRILQIKSEALHTYIYIYDEMITYVKYRLIPIRPGGNS